MDINFKDKVYLVTGGASGIGEAVVHYIAQHEGMAVIADIDDEAGAALAAKFPKQLRYLHTDVTKLAQLEAACALAQTTFGGLDGAVNSAGIGSLGNVADMPLEEWHKVIDIDLHGVFHACRAALPLLRKRGGGCIVNIASLSGVRADYGFAAYNSAKAAVINLTRTMALDHAQENIRATAVCPGYIATPLTAGASAIEAIDKDWLARIPMHRAGTAEEVAQLVVFLLSPAASYITGTEIVIDGGLGSSNNQPNIPGIFAGM
jgi:meso-butanediol dehydrogenase / (S,S)-butanediol dehydrogenase / diacetyl reductase